MAALFATGRLGAELAGTFLRTVVTHAGEHVGQKVGEHVVKTATSAYKARMRPTRRRK